MYILIAFIINAQGAITSINQEFSDYSKCANAKVAVEQGYPANYVKAVCVAK